MERLKIDNIKNIILGYEKKWPVETWRINGIDIWPYIRTKLYIHYLKSINDKSIPANKHPRSFHKKRFYKVGIPFQVLKAFYKLIFFFKQLKKKDIVFFGSHFHRSKHKEGYFNRFFDAMVATHHLEDRVYMVEFQKVYSENYNQKAIIPLNLYLSYYKIIKKLYLKLITQPIELHLNKYDSFISALKHDKIDTDILNINQKNLIKWTLKVQSNKGFFKTFLQKTAPKKVFFLSYYGFDDLTSAILACRKLKIPAIDFQHGPQTNIHMVYSYWSKMPKEGYNIMPIEYWNWDTPSKENIDKWASNTSIKAKVVGQPYLAYNLNKSNIQKNKRNYIFFSLQTFALQEMIPKQLLTCISQSKYIWILRLHPRSSFNASDLNQYLENNNVVASKYKIEEANSNPISETLASSILHVTNFSGCLIEAKMMGVPTLLIHNLGNELFNQYIDSNYVYFLNPFDAEFNKGLSNIIENVKDKKEQIKQEVVNPLKVS